MSARVPKISTAESARIRLSERTVISRRERISIALAGSTQSISATCSTSATRSCERLDGVGTQPSGWSKTRARSKLDHSLIFNNRTRNLLSSRKGDEGEFRALKVLTAESYSESRPIYEREILTHLREEDRSHPGYKFICHLIDDFQMEGPNGMHVCLVFELMGETLDTYRTVFEKQMTPNLLMRKFTYQLLLALDYAHDSGVIHTGTVPSPATLLPCPLPYSIFSCNSLLSKLEIPTKVSA